LRTHNPDIDWREGVLNIPPKKLTNTLGPRKGTTNNKARSIHEPQARLSITLINAVAY